PGLARLLDVLELDGLELTASQHVPGASLAEITAARGLFTLADARPALGQLAAAMTHAHHVGIILGDVRPTAAVLSGDVVKLTSLGVALALPRERYLGAMATHPEYAHLSPELRMGAPCDVRADVYSLGALAWVLLCGTDLESARAGLRPDLPPLLLA